MSNVENQPTGHGPNGLKRVRLMVAVGPGEIRDFRGAMMGRADKGLFIITGTFTPIAVKEATRDGAPPIDPLNGSDASEQLRELKLGVPTENIEVVQIEEQWFESVGRGTLSGR